MKNSLFYVYTVLLSISVFPLSAQVACGALEGAVVPLGNMFVKGERNVGLRNSVKAIPIQFHVTRPSDGVSGFEPRFVDSILVVLNEGFAGTPFEFYSCSGVNYIDNDAHLSKTMI